MSANASAIESRLRFSVAQVPTVGTTTYVPLLDGFRAVSIALVILSHLLIYNPASYFLYRAGLACGYTGVSFFFVLSGYLITTLLLQEEEKKGHIQIGNFYLRRAFRILPAAYAFLFVLAGLAAAQYVAIPIHDFAASFFYVRNVIGRSHETAHLWSLAIEEQFYFLWPLFLVVVPQRRRVLAVTAVISSVCAWRMFLVFTGWASAGALYSRTDLRLDTVLTGCLLALLLQRRSHFTAGTLGPAASLAAGCAGLLIWKVIASEWARADALDSSLTAVSAALILYGLLNSHGFSRACLEGSMVVLIGRLSYGIYLWQQLFFGPAEAFSGLRIFPVNMLLTLAAATASFYFVEKPFLRLRERFVR